METNKTIFFVNGSEISQNIFQYQGKFIGSESRENQTFRQFRTAYEEINVCFMPYITASVSSIKS